jgi:hypothetical protein
LYFGRIAPDNSAWETIEGSFSATGQIKEYKQQVNFSSKTLGAQPLVGVLNRINKLKQLIQTSKENRAVKTVIIKLLDQLEKMIRKLANETGVRLDVYSNIAIEEVDELISRSKKPSMEEILGQLRLIKLDILQYLENK